jgi:hypothetical protein
LGGNGAGGNETERPGDGLSAAGASVSVGHHDELENNGCSRVLERVYENET